MKPSTRRASFALLSVIAMIPTCVSAQQKTPTPSGAYPSKTVRFIITFPPGGATDILARVLAQKLRDTMGQQFLIDNRIGAAGNMGAELAARAAPDGYTLLMSTVGNAINASLASRQTYDIVRDFEAVSELATSSFMLVVHAGVAATSVKELVTLAKAKPGALNYGSSGTGGPSHLSMELFKNATQLNIVHVPYKGSGPASADVAAGQIHMMFTGLSTAQPFMTAGKLRALAIGRPKRLPGAPDIPTIDEAGVKGFEASTWFGVHVPAKTPRPIITALHRAIVTVLRQPDTVERFEGQGYDLIGSSPEEFSAYVRNEVPKWASAVKKSGARLD